MTKDLKLSSNQYIKIGLIVPPLILQILMTESNAVVLQMIPPKGGFYLDLERATRV